MGFLGDHIRTQKAKFDFSAIAFHVLQQIQLFDLYPLPALLLQTKVSDLCLRGIPGKLVVSRSPKLIWLSLVGKHCYLTFSSTFRINMIISFSIGQ